MGKFTLNQLVAPLSPDDFLNGYWESKFVHLSHEAGYFNNVLSVEDIDQYLSRQDLTPAAIKIVKNAERIPELKWTKTATLLDGSTTVTVNNTELFRLYTGGATIIINSAQRAIPCLAAACRLFEQELKIKIQANIYVTPPRSQGFGRHYDPHDVLLLQIKGPKTWRVYNSSEELPTTYSRVEKETVLVSQFEIHSGDFLYLPRGTPHEAFSSDAATIHVTFSCKPKYGFDLIHELARCAEKDDVFFRKIIPHGLNNQEETAEYAALFAEKLNELLNRIPPIQLLKSQDENFAQEQLIDFKGRLTNILQVEDINTETVVCRVANLSYAVDNDSDGLRICFGKNSRIIPSFVKADIFLSDTPFKIKDIQGLITNQGRITLVGELMQIGYLKIDAL